MDRGEDWIHTFNPPLPDFSVNEANFICHRDGGTRAGSCSAAAWYLEAIVTRGDMQYTFPVAMEGKFLKQPISSFTAELIGLDEAIRYTHNLILKPNPRSLKRAREV